MPTVEITREQLAYVEALREELEDEVPYGQVRNLDAIQYLIDHHREDGDLDVEIEGDLDADPEEATDGGTSAGGPGTEAGSPDPTAEDPGSADASGAGQATDASGVDAGEDGPTADSPPTPDPGALGSGSDAGGSGSDADGSGGTGSTTTRVSGGPDPSALSGGGSDKVNEMMNLLEAHDDKWSEASSGDAKYQVELPDGDVESAATKDDVRALLFKNYR